MQVLRARSAGFCLGVSLALKRLDQELTASGKSGTGNGPAGRLITLGPIIHNPLVMQHYASLGVVCTEDIADIRPGDRVVIRAHGIPKTVEEQLAASGATVIDATCPKVKKAQLSIAKAHNKGGAMLLFGEREHPEVRGLLSYAGSDAQVFGSLAELERILPEPGAPCFLAAQTTQDRTTFEEAKHRLEEQGGRKPRVLDTICDATRSRQQEVLELCTRVDVVVVVGGLNSGNTKRLAEVARAAGTPAIHIEQVADIDDETRETLLKTASIIGLTAGASTPDAHINAMEEYLTAL